VSPGRWLRSVWQGVNAGTEFVASALWVNHPPPASAVVFIASDGESALTREVVFDPRPDPYAEDGGEG
jgi:hypothetical protein